MTEEEPKRLRPLPDTLRELFLKSGNLCAFPNCTRLMINEHGAFVGQMCHIEGVKGERFNPDMTNEKRRGFSNLMLMCYEHHSVTNDEIEFTVEKLTEMKREHEQRFSSPDRVILEHLVDWTTIDQPVGAKNLKRVNEVLQWGLLDADLEITARDLNDYIDLMSTVPVEVRRFVGVLAQRIRRLRNSQATYCGIFGSTILASDVEAAFKLGAQQVHQRVSQLEGYGIGGIDEIDSDLGPQPAIAIHATHDGLNVWMEVAAFCEATDTPIERFSEELDFSAFDS